MTGAMLATMTQEAAGVARALVRGVAADVTATRATVTASTIAARPTMRPISEQQATAATDLLRRSFAWEDDFNCFERATIGAQAMNRAFAGRVAGPDDAVRGAVAIMPTDPATTGWRFHAATAFQDQSTGGVRVFDPLTDAEPLPVADWARRHGVEPSVVQVRHPLAGENLASLGETAATARDATLRLRSATVTDEGARNLLRTIFQQEHRA